MPSRIRRRTIALITITMVLLLVAGSHVTRAVGAEDITFHHAIDNSPLDLTPKPGEKLTDAVLEFRKSGKNPYSGKDDAIANGKKIYMTFCQSCHLPDGSGRMGPSLIGPKHKYERVGSDIGLFEVVYGGAFGAMQPFSKRFTQDQILLVTAFVRTLMKQ